MPDKPKPLAIYTLGRFSIVRHGHSLAVASRLPHKPVELLQALVALGGREVSAHAICSAVWPEQGSIDPRNLLDNTLHRLRALLGDRAAITVSDAKLSLNPQHCWVDAWAFERLAAHGLMGAHDTGPPDAVAALHLYQGHFLQREEPRPWLLDYRARLHTRFTRLMLHEGERLEAAGRWADAADWYASGLEVDPACDSLLQRLSACRLRHTRPAAPALGPLISGPSLRPL